MDLPKAIDGFERRILAFGRLYDLLSNGSDRRYTSVGDYVGPLSLAPAAAILEPRGIRCEATIGNRVRGIFRIRCTGCANADQHIDVQRHEFGCHALKSFRRLIWKTVFEDEIAPLDVANVFESLKQCSEVRPFFLRVGGVP